MSLFGTLANRGLKGCFKSHRRWKDREKKRKRLKQAHFMSEERGPVCVYPPRCVCDWAPYSVLAHFKLLVLVKAQRKVWSSDAMIGEGGLTITMVILIQRKRFLITCQYLTDTCKLQVLWQQYTGPYYWFLSANLTASLNLLIQFLWRTDSHIKVLDNWTRARCCVKVHQRRKGKTTQLWCNLFILSSTDQHFCTYCLL